MESRQYCPICHFPAYPFESERVDGCLYHKGCFKCSICRTRLTLQSFLTSRGKLYCKVHYPKPALARTIITYEDGIYCEIRNDFEVNSVQDNQNAKFQKLASSMFFGEDHVKCDVVDVYDHLLDLLPQIVFRIPYETEINVDCFNLLKKELSGVLGADEFAIIGLEKGSVIGKIALLKCIEKLHDKTAAVKEKAMTAARKIKEQLSINEVKPSSVKLFIQSNETNGIENALFSIKTQDPCSFNSLSSLDESDYAEIEQKLSEYANNRENVTLDTIKKMESHYQQFDKALEASLKDSPFEYCITGLSIVRRHIEEFEQKKAQCSNCETKILFHGTNAKAVNSILCSHFLNGKDFYAGIGTYFSDMIDVAAIYSGQNSTNARLVILPVGETFDFVACEVYYDSAKFVYIKDDRMCCLKDLNGMSRDEIKVKFGEKVVPVNGIYYADTSPSGGAVISDVAKYKGKFTMREFVVFEHAQIAPLYGVTMKRTDRLILFRDTNFGKNNQFTEFLSARRSFAKEFSKCNVYFENETESALRLIEKKKYNKIAIITNNGADSGGIQFVKRAREIIGSDVVVLFMCKDESNIMWIQELSNVLYTNKEEFFERFVTDFTEAGIEKLREDINKFYDIEERFGAELSEFTDGFYKFPHYEEFKSGGYLGELHFEPVKEQ